MADSEVASVSVAASSVAAINRLQQLIHLAAPGRKVNKAAVAFPFPKAKCETSTSTKATICARCPKNRTNLRLVQLLSTAVPAELTNPLTFPLLQAAASGLCRLMKCGCRTGV